MRTTLTIDADIAVQLERLRKERNASLKSLVNEALRQGLKQLVSEPARKPFRTRTFDAGPPLIDNIDNIAEVRVIPLMLIDANLLIYASIEGFAQHSRAKNWLDGQLAGSRGVGLPWESLLAFLRVVTNPRALTRPLSIADAWNQVIAWLGHRRVWVPAPTERHPDLLAELIAATGARANLVHDAHLAAIAIGHGLSLYSADRDFGRFPGLRWENPLAD
jgi:hypothetical protein